MIRPFTFLTLVAACGSGMYLYSEKHRAELLDRQIAHVIHETEATRQSTSLLQAEWQVLNNPDRLRPLAAKYLNLVPVQPNQWVQLSDLSTRLPATVPQNQGGATDDAAADATAAADTPSPDTPVADAPLTAAPANPGVDEAVLTAPKPVAQDHAATPQAATRLAARTAPKKHPPVALADADPPLHAKPLAHSTPLALATPQPARARIVSAMARPVHVVQPALATAVPSALGVRTAVPPPVPMGAE
jgi:hypothetical protein